jgi:hypothetical protein
LSAPLTIARLERFEPRGEVYRNLRRCADLNLQVFRSFPRHVSGFNLAKLREGWEPAAIFQREKQHFSMRPGDFFQFLSNTF